ncbi:MAG TPA: outer membrane beta-barrel protein [Ignavibacteriaceae bacterium]|nr:outer membrane beta-barrel protein [Ignavibacteriaceae bacterium]
MHKYTLLLLILFVLPVNAQFNLGLNGAAAIPTGYNEDYVDLGFGGNVNITYPVDFLNMELSLTSGYYYFGLKENLPEYNYSYSTIPVLAGVKIRLYEGSIVPYIGFEAGAYITRYDLELDYGYVFKYNVITKETHFGFAPELGFRLPLNEYFNVDVKAKYNRVNTKYVSRAFVLIQTGFNFLIDF